VPLSGVRRLAGYITEALWLAAVTLVPLAVNLWGLAYEAPKVALFRGLVLLMAAAHFLVLAWAPWLPDPRRWLRRPLVRPILGVAGVTLLSTLASLNPLISAWGTYHRQQGAYFSACLILWSLLIAARLRGPARQRLTVTIVIAGVLVALTPFAETFLRHKNPFTWRPGGSLGNPIFLGAYLIMTLPFTLAGLIGALQTEPRSRLRLFAWSGAAALQATALLATQSRGPWVGALVGLALFAALTFGPGHRRWVLGIMAVITALVAVLVAGFKFGLVPGEQISRLPYLRRIVAATDLTGGTVRVRLVLWQAAAGVLARWPHVGLEPDPLRFLRPLVGYGPDTGSVVYTAVYPPELAHIEDPSAIWDRAHNETLDLLVMQGALGLLATAVLGLACLRRGLSLWRAASGPAGRAAAAAPLSALVAHAIEVQFAFSVTATAMMAWLCVGLLACWDQERSGAGGSRSDGSEARVPLRWRVYAVIGAMLLVATAVRVEGGAIWTDVLVARARALDRAGRWDESIDLYNQAQEIAPWQPIYYQFHAEALYNLARALPDDALDLKVGLLEAADRNLAEARRLDPLELEYYANAGILHAYWSEAVDPTHLDTAVAFLEQAAQLAPTRVDLRIDLGHVYHNHGRYEEALEQYQIALQIDPASAGAYYSAGEAWLALGQPDQAREALQAALELAPNCDLCRSALEDLEAEGW